MREELAGGGGGAGCGWCVLPRAPGRRPGTLKTGPRVLGAWLSPRGRRARLGAAPWGLETREKTRAGAARPPSCRDERESPPGLPAPAPCAGSRAVLEMAGVGGAPRCFGPCRVLREGHGLPGPLTPAPPLSSPQTRPPSGHGVFAAGPAGKRRPARAPLAPRPFGAFDPSFPGGRAEGGREAARRPGRGPSANLKLCLRESGRLPWGRFAVAH